MRLLVCAAALCLALPLTAPAAAQSLDYADAVDAAVDAALRHVAQQAASLGVTDADVADLVVTDAVPSRRSGLTYVYVRQAVGGIEVLGTELTVAVDRNGAVVNRAGTFTRDLAAKVPSVRLRLDAPESVRRAAGHLGVDSPRLRKLAQAMGAGRATTFAQTDAVLTRILSRLVFVQPEFVRSGGDAAYQLAWRVELAPRSAGRLYHIYVDAATGAEVRRDDLTVDEHAGLPSTGRAPSLAPLAAAPAPSLLSATAPIPMSVNDGSSYNVYALPLESPNHGNRSIATNPADAIASPFGWHDTNGATGPEFTITRGNNVHAYLDRDGSANVPDPGSEPDGGASLDFDYPINLSQDPVNYQDAAVTNLFYWNNVTHDLLYRYGFDEVSGNFQVNSYGNGGQGGDAVRAEAQDGGGINNANMFTPSDGSEPRMQMFLWQDTNPRRDGDLDAGIVIHEYVHGLSNRLTGGPNNVGCLNGNERMGEGWSDYYAAMFTMRPGDTRTTNRGIGTYSIGEPITGDGIRPAPYNTSFAVNDFTYGDTRDACFLFCSLSVPHGVGFVWATMLWDMTWDLIDQFGFSEDFYDADGTAGNQIALNLVTEGMKLQRCNPGFVDGRDAILAADDALYGGVHKDLIWAAFARRGLGFSAVQGTSSSVTDNREAFDLPPGGGNVDPVAGFVADCDGLTCDFTDTSSDADGSITGRSWDFGDGATSSATNPRHIYASDGTYTVTLTVTDNGGATDEASQAVAVSDGGGVEDTTPPALSGSIRGSKYEGTASDAGSGIASVTLRDATNLDLDVDGFPAGASSVNFDITLVNNRDQGKGYVVATDVAGNTADLWVCSDGCDPPGTGGGDPDTTPPSVT
ncbi:MAG: M36 family metallopeptidase, partial [Bacteroidota bacterium]